MGTIQLLCADITDRILAVYYEVYNELGYGFLESLYESAMAMALRQAGLKVVTQVDIPVSFRGERIGSYKADMVVEGKVIVELKAARNLDSANDAQLLHYLRATSLEVGLLLNFGPHPQIRRLVFENSRKSALIRGQKASRSNENRLRLRLACVSAWCSA